MKRQIAGLAGLGLLGAMLLSGCADIRVEIGCQGNAPTVTNAPTHTIQKHRECGLQR